MGKEILVIHASEKFWLSGDSMPIRPHHTLTNVK